MNQSEVSVFYNLCLKVLQRKEKECSSLLGKCEDEQTLAGKLNTQIKELQARLDEIDEDLEAERQGPYDSFFL